MHHVSILNKAPIRLALLYAAVFFIALMLAAILAFHTIQNHFSNRLDQQVYDKYTRVLQQSSVEDSRSVVTTINTHISVFDNRHHIYLLRTSDGSPLAGNIKNNSQLSGYVTLNGGELGQSINSQYRIYANRVNDMDLWVGISDSDTARIQRIVYESIGLASLLALLITLGGAVWLAHRSQIRVNALSSAMSAIGEGKLDTRLLVSSRKDDIDNISIEVNSTLDRLQSMITALDDISINIAHDLKTPINRLFIGVDTAIDKVNNNQDVKQDLADFHDELSQINVTFDALLRIGSIERNTKKNNFDYVDLNLLIEKIVDIYLPVYEDANMVLAIGNKHETALPIYADESLLTQLFINLLENSLRYCPAQSRVLLTTGTSHNRAFVSIADEGPGIPDSEKDNVFGRLYRLDKSRTTQGAGMGLSLVKSIVQLHDASIQLSDNDPGLIVTVFFRS